MVDQYGWNNSGLILTDIRAVTYLQSKTSFGVSFESDFSILFPRFSEYTAVVYTIGLGKSLLRYNLTQDNIFGDMIFNRVYDDALSAIGTANAERE